MAQQVVGRQTGLYTTYEHKFCHDKSGRRQEVYNDGSVPDLAAFSDAMNPALVESSGGMVPWATSTNTEFHGGQLDVKSAETQYFAHSMEPYGKQNQYGPPGASESTFGQTYTDQISISGTVNPQHTTTLTQWLKNNPTFTSVIRRYSGLEETFYFASVGHGEARRRGSVVLRDPASFQAVAVEFFNQTNDPLLSRAVWGHGRFTRDESMPFLYSGFKVKESSYNGVNFDLITAPDANSWLPEHHQVKLTLDYNFPNPKVNFRDLIDVLSPVGVLAALYKLPINERKIYLEHQRTYLNGWVRVDWSFLEQGTARVTALYGQHVQVLRPDGDVWRVL
ncbi:hypothetical protein B0H14DRAFT_2644121 [Mycena olivaceomarginata]|nr:hypothetical protein B0H14DRAFT_2644121 [Mycena olivaceomarginata]